MIDGFEPALVVELLLLGSVAGFLAGLLGVGGGMMMVPFMTLLLSLRGVADAHVVRVAVATSLATILFTSVAALRAHHRHSAVRWPVVKLLAPGIVLGSLVGAQIARVLPAAAMATPSSTKKRLRAQNSMILATMAGP